MRSVDEQVKAPGMTGSSESRVRRLCAEINDKVNTFLGRSWRATRPVLWIDARHVN